MTECMQVTEYIFRYELLIDGLLAKYTLGRRGTASALPIRVIAVPLLFVYSSSASAPNPAPAVAHVDSIRMTTIVLLESSMRQFHKRHSICQTLITTVVPGSS